MRGPEQKKFKWGTGIEKKKKKIYSIFFFWNWWGHWGDRLGPWSPHNWKQGDQSKKNLNGGSELKNKKIKNKKFTAFTTSATSICPLKCCATHLLHYVLTLVSAHHVLHFNCCFLWLYFLFWIRIVFFLDLLLWVIYKENDVDFRLFWVDEK